MGRQAITGDRMKKQVLGLGIAISVAGLPVRAHAENLLDLLFGNQQQEIIQQPQLEQQFPAAPKQIGRAHV